MAMIELSFKPQGPVVNAYVADTGRRAFILGPLGSSKTYASCWKAFRAMLNQEPDGSGIRHTRGVAVRNTYSELLGTTAKDWLELFGHLGRMVGGGRGAPTQTLRFKLPDGTRVYSEMVFLALDREEHIRKLRGLQLTFAMLSEVKELPFGIVSMIDLRTGRYPSGNPGCTWHGIFGDTNAPDTDHWYYSMAEDVKPPGWTFYRQPGGLVRDSKDAPWRINWNAENLRNLPGTPGAYYLEGSQGKGDDWVAVNLANEYGFVRNGKPVYPDYRDFTHCAAFELVKELGIHVGLDFGLTPAAVIGQRNFNGAWRIRHELVTEDTGIHRFAGELNRFLNDHYKGWPVMGIYGDPAGGQRQAGDVDERTVFQILAANGIDCTPAPGDNDITLRIETFAAPMLKMIDGKPAFQIHPDCKSLRKGLQGGYAYKRIKVVGDDKWRDLPDKNKYSHPADAGQYMMLGAGEGAKVLASTVAHAAREYDDFRSAMGYA